MERLTIREVAEELGVSVDTVRRRLRAGMLNGELVDGKWVIELPDEVRKLGKRMTAEHESTRLLISSLRETNELLSEKILTRIDDLRVEVAELKMAILGDREEPRRRGFLRGS